MGVGLNILKVTCLIKEVHEMYNSMQLNFIVRETIQNTQKISLSSQPVQSHDADSKWVAVNYLLKLRLQLGIFDLIAILV